MCAICSCSRWSLCTILALGVAGIIPWWMVIVVAARDCRCPSCGKRIINGVLVLDTCPRCKRNLYTGEKPKKAKKK